MFDSCPWCAGTGRQGGLAWGACSHLTVRSLRSTLPLCHACCGLGGRPREDEPRRIQDILPRDTNGQGEKRGELSPAAKKLR